MRPQCPEQVEPINSYGRRVIHNQEMAHNRLVDKATCMTDCRMSDISKQQRTFHREAQGWKLSYNEMVQRSMEVPSPSRDPYVYCAVMARTLIVRP